MEAEIGLREREQREVALSPQELTALRQVFASRLAIYATGEPGRYVVATGSVVGFVALPGGRTLVIEPKVRIDTLFALLAAVYDPCDDFLREEPQAYTTVRELFEFVVRIFAVQVEDLVARGILRGYRIFTDEPAAVRGRLLLTETLRRRPGLHDRHTCRFSQFTADVPENRILRWTSFCLQPLRYREVGLAGRLGRLSRALSGAHLDPMARQLYERLNYHRLNDPYRPALSLARLLLDGLTFSGSAGEEPFLGYLIDMDELFERYVGTVLRRAAPGWGALAREQDPHALDEARQVHLRPDITLYGRDGPILVVDAKYKREAAHADLYQMLAYCHALGVGEAVLVHPASEQAPSGSVAVRGPGSIQVHYLSLDLGGGPAQLEEQAKALAGAVWALVGRSPGV
ncbi:MAG: McrC family protein [Anaerolineae bacterium]|nr:McrC family protein [Anaerolineae bacterium]